MAKAEQLHSVKGMDDATGAIGDMEVEEGQASMNNIGLTNHEQVENDRTGAISTSSTFSGSGTFSGAISAYST